MNRTVEEAEKIALSILKPSRKQLEHGLELHKNSIVCESYGFSPRCAVYGDRLAEAVNAGASPLELQNMREEMSMTRCVEDEQERKEYLDAWEKSGVTCIFQNAGEEEQDVKGAIKRLAHFTYVTDMLGDYVFKASRPEDIERAKREGKHCLYMTSNTTPLAESRVSVEEELQFIKIFFNLGVRMTHLTYNRRNVIGDGCAEASDAGLSDFGRAVVAEMNRAGIIADISHSGQKTSFEAAKASSLPVVASHSGAHSLNGHIRCKTDEVMKAIVDGGGYIGVFCVPRFLGLSGDISAFLDHIDYIVKKFGIEHAAIGTDIAYGSSRREEEISKIPRIPSARKHWRSLWPPDNEEEIKKFAGKENSKSLAWTNWPIFTVGLVMRGYSDGDIQKIIGGNVLRVAKEVFNRREP